MLVRIRLRSRPRLQRKRRRSVAPAIASLLTPIAVMADVVVGWKITAELNITSQFPFTDGVLSHWQVWMAAALVLHLGAVLLSRYRRRTRIVHKATIQPDLDRERKLANSGY